MAAVVIRMSPILMCSRKAAELPMRMKVLAPMLANSSTAMAADGQPMPVEHTLTPTPL